MRRACLCLQWDGRPARQSARRAERSHEETGETPVLLKTLTSRSRKGKHLRYFRNPYPFPGCGQLPESSPRRRPSTSVQSQTPGPSREGQVVHFPMPAELSNLMAMNKDHLCPRPAGQQGGQWLFIRQEIGLHASKIRESPWKRAAWPANQVWMHRGNGLNNDCKGR
jgi:hypothetical protein